MSDKPLKRSERIFAGIIDHPRWCLATLIAITLVAVAGYIRPQWPHELAQALSPTGEIPPAVVDAQPSSPPPTRMRRGSSTQRATTAAVGTGDAILVVQSDGFFTQDGASAIRLIVDRLEELDVVSHVMWIDETPPLNIFGLPEPFLPRGQASAQKFAIAKERACKHPLVAGQFMSPDARTMLLFVSYDWINVRSNHDCIGRLLDTARSAAKEYPSVPITIDITGGVPIRLMLIEEHEANELKYQLIGYGMTLLMAAIMFRGLTVVIVVALAPAVGVFWTLGMLRYFDLQENPFSNVILPVLLSLVGFNDSVHMMVYIRRCLTDGMSPKESCRKALGAVGMACLLTLFTTSIGMGSLSFAGHEIVREFGWSCVLGVTATWASVVLVIPLICCTRWSNRLAKGADRGIVDRNLDYIVSWVRVTVRHAKAVSFAAIGLMVVCSAIALTLKPDDRRGTALPNSNNAQRVLAHLDKSMGGLETCNIRVYWGEDVVDETEIVNVLESVDQILDAEPLIGHPLSICKLVAALPGDDSVREKFSMNELLPPPLKLAFYSPDGRNASTSFRVMDLGTVAYQDTFERIERGLEQIRQKHPGFNVEMVGEPIWRWRNVYKIVSDLSRSLGTAALEIFFVLTFAFRSLRLGLISIFPNLIPLSVGATWMALTGQPLEIVSVCAFTVCLGIAVDDTIHFLHRYREEQAHFKDRSIAIQRAFEAVGTGMIMTTAVLVAGFSSVLTSETRDHRIFASLGIITLVIALLCDLFMLPALLVYFDRDRTKKIPILEAEATVSSEDPPS